MSIRRLYLFCIRLFLWGVGVCIVGYLCWIYILPQDIPPRPYSTILLDRHGERIGELLSTEEKRHELVVRDDISEFVSGAVIALEDERFQDHRGVDIQSIGRSLWYRITDTPNPGGASTITMGLARNILGVTRERTWNNKIKEIWLALRIEAGNTKPEILRSYLEHISFGRLAEGFQSASRTYFGKDLRSLTRAEELALVTLIQNPVRYDPIREPAAFRMRYESLVEILKQKGKISDTRDFLEEKLAFQIPEDRLPYISDALEKYPDWHNSQGAVVSLSIDRALTTKIQSIAEEVRISLRDRNVSDYGILIIDRATHTPRVMIGGSSYQGEAGQVNSVLSPRQVGSTIKPFTYLLALEQGKKLSDTILDAPVWYQTSEGYSYEPKNYSLRYRGNISLAEALAGSVNIPAVKIAKEVWVGKLLEFLRSLGISTLRESADHYGLALTLGVGEVSLYELLRAYGIFADRGNLCEIRWTLKAESTPSNCTLFAGARETEMIEEALSNTRYKIAEFPEWSALNFGEKRVFVKTGTSRNFRDNYAVGYTGQYLIAIWTWNKDGSNMRWVSGASGAGEIFARIVAVLPNAVLIQSPLQKDLENKISLSGSSKSESFFEISRPLPGTRYKKDPLLPDETQRFSIKFETNIAYDEVRYLLDGKKLTDLFIDISSLRPGNHQVQVEVIKDKKVFQSISRSFEVVE